MRPIVPSQGERPNDLARQSQPMSTRAPELYADELNLFRDEMRTARRGMRIAWAVVAGLIAFDVVALWWVTDGFRDQMVEMAELGEQRDELADHLDESVRALANQQERLETVTGELADSEAEGKAQRTLVASLTERNDRLLVDLLAAHEALATARATVEAGGQVVDSMLVPVVRPTFREVKSPADLPEGLDNLDGTKQDDADDTASATP